MSDEFKHEAPIKQFLERVTAYRAALDQERTTAALTALVDRFVENFAQTVKVKPSKAQVEEYRATEAAAIAAAQAAEDAALEQRYAELHREYSVARAGFEELPEERVALCQRQGGGASTTDLYLADLVDAQRADRIERRLAGATFDQVDAVHAAAVERGDVPTQRVLEQHMREKWPTVTKTAAGLAADLTAQKRLEARITVERAKRVPATVREGLTAIERQWNQFQFRELRRIARAQRFGIAG